MLNYCVLFVDNMISKLYRYFAICNDDIGCGISVLNVLDLEV